jgi:hypothetical protein
MSHKPWPRGYLTAEAAYTKIELDKFYEVDSNAWRDEHRSDVLCKREEFRLKWIEEHGDWNTAPTILVTYSYTSIVDGEGVTIIHSEPIDILKFMESLSYNSNLPNSYITNIKMEVVSNELD